MVLFHKLSRFKISPKVKEPFEVLYLQSFTTQYVFINGYISIGNATDKKPKGLMVGINPRMTMHHQDHWTLLVP